MTYIIASEITIGARGAAVYRVLADYEAGRPKIIPSRHFSRMIVEEGGYGAGTRVWFERRSLRGPRGVRIAVSEPKPGQVLKEIDLATGDTTTLRVAEETDERCVRVTMSSTLGRRTGVVGALAGLWEAARLRRVQQATLRLLAAQFGGGFERSSGGGSARVSSGAVPGGRRTGWRSAPPRPQLGIGEDIRARLIEAP